MGSNRGKSLPCAMARHYTWQERPPGQHRGIDELQVRPDGLIARTERGHPDGQVIYLHNKSALEGLENCDHPLSAVRVMPKTARFRAFRPHRND